MLFVAVFLAAFFAYVFGEALGLAGFFYTSKSSSESIST
jgi:hypothetical protein